MDFDALERYVHSSRALSKGTYNNISSRKQEGTKSVQDGTRFDKCRTCYRAEGPPASMVHDEVRSRASVGPFPVSSKT